MTENTNSTVFGFGGIGGMLIATALLIIILVALTIWGIKAQNEVMQNPYTLENRGDIKQFGSSRDEHVIVKDKK